MLQNPYKLLVVDDDDRLRQLLQQYLQDSGHKVDVAENAPQARKMMVDGDYDLVVLDVMMPGETGVQLTNSLRRETRNPLHSIPILLLTAMGDIQDRIKGLESGADDYMSKPFEPKELLLRIQQILKRTRAHKPSQKMTIEFGDFIYNVDHKSLYKGTEPIYLTSTESELLYLLVTNLGVPLSRYDLSESAGITLSPRTIDVQITRLRKKIEKDPKKPEHIRTIRHKGYGFFNKTLFNGSS